MGLSGLSQINTAQSSPPKTMAIEKEIEATSDPEVEEEEPEEEEEEDLVDPHDSAKGVCASKPECMSLKDKLDECNTRVEGKSRTSETCVEEIIDWMHCVDECAAKGLFAKLK